MDFHHAEKGAVKHLQTDMFYHLFIAMLSWNSRRRKNIMWETEYSNKPLMKVSINAWSLNVPKSSVPQSPFFASGSDV
jgi:hypothetical protein